MGLTRTPSQYGKITAQPLSSPSVQSVLRTKTNYQQLPSALDTSNGNGNSNNEAPLKKKNTLTRTFSAVLDNSISVNNNNNNTASTDTAPTTPSSSDNRRRSLTKRGAAKARLLVHKDEDVEDGADEEPDTSFGHVADSPAAKIASNTGRSNPTTLLVKSAAVETATTLLSIERASRSQDKVVVGPAEVETKRRALTNDEDVWDIEYAPPREEEQPYDPGFELDAFALTTVPPALAYHTRSIGNFDIGLPDMTPAKIRRSGSPNGLEEKEQEQDSQQRDSDDDDDSLDRMAAMPKSSVTADGFINVVWSDEEDDEDDHAAHPKGGRCFGIKDLQDVSKTRPPFDGFAFDIEASEDSLSEDEDDIFADNSLNAKNSMKGSSSSKKEVDEFNDAFGLSDLEDESKLQAPFSDDFAFQL
ncbi:hypothetical protein BGZ99_002209 [Dissophora globulifera]|uniref:Uncharacterized protein n=1 Tax=Dissophora globulifera TaxID=979702 RepID=A0A9P6RS54_9FUNG|nr:hypothetical protein BGZ99_002209 [Dissophora globulifera]